MKQKLQTLVSASLIAASFGASSMAFASDDSYYYFRCNSTDWGVGPENRLFEELSPGVLQLSYQVDQAWMMNSGDDCVVVETKVEDAWGVDHKRYGVHFYNYVFEAPSSHVIKEAADGEAHFKVRYPELGQYTATLDTRSKTLSINKKGETEPGGVAWTASGGLLLDQSGNAYLINSSAGSSFSKLDLDTGIATWVYTDGGYFRPDQACITDTRIVGITNSGNDRALTGINAQTGEVAWTQTFNGAFAGSYPSVRCNLDQDEVVVTWGRNWEYRGVVNKQNGNALWQSYVGESNYTPFWNDEAIIFQERDYANQTSSLKAYSPTTGAVMWTKSIAYDVDLTSNNGNLYTVNDAGILQKLNVSTGEAVWQYNSNIERVWPRFANGSLYLEKWNETLVSINTNTGNPLWTKNLASYGADSVGLIAPYLEEAYLSIRNNSNNTSMIVAFSDATGADQWTYQSATNNYMNMQKVDNEYYILEGHHLRKVNETGTVIWSAHFETTENDYYPGRVSRVVDADEDKLYVTYFGHGYKYPPGGVSALNRETGAEIWDWFENTLALFGGSTEDKIFMVKGFGFETVAIVK